MVSEQHSIPEALLAQSQAAEIAQRACKRANVVFFGTAIDEINKPSRILVIYGYNSDPAFNILAWYPLSPTGYGVVPFNPLFDNEDTLRDAIRDAVKVGTS